MAGEDDAYREWVRTQPCCAPCAPSGCWPNIEAHHAGSSGMGQRAHDHTCIPLCSAHHVPGLHQNAGPFKGWKREQLRDWQDERIEELRTRYARREFCADMFY